LKGSKKRDKKTSKGTAGARIQIQQLTVKQREKKPSKGTAIARNRTAFRN
jgi:hypothetical protein